MNYWHKKVASFWGALDKDFSMGVSSQSPMASGANTKLRFGVTEWCSAKFHWDVEFAIA